MNRITNKEYLIDITLKYLFLQQPLEPSKARCQVYFSDEGYLRIQIQPVVRNGAAYFCDEHMRIPFASEVSLVFKLLKTNKKEYYLGHYSLDIQKMLTDKMFHFKVKDKLEEADAYAEFQCRIIDKDLLAESDEEEAPEVETINKSIATWMNKGGSKIKVNKPLTQYNSPFRIMKKTAGNHVPLPPEDYGKLVRATEDILAKRQLFSQRHTVLNCFTRDRYGNLQTEKIQELQARLKVVKKEAFNSNLFLYFIVSMIALFVGMKL